MAQRHLLVEYTSDVNKILKQTFQSMQRIKLCCFDCSSKYLVFGATSGGIYIFRREPCEFLKLIPSKEGCAVLMSMSRDERHMGIASSRGLVLIINNFHEDSSLQYQVFSEHEGSSVTCLKWYRNDLYVGDSMGKVSVISVETLFQTKSIFQLPTLTLMNLESPIVQIDCFERYLVISTRAKTYLSNTDKEYFIQIGKKSRDGVFGACFLNSSAADLGYHYSAVPNSRNAFRFAKESEVVISNDSANARIFCARPGARLWEAGFDAQVLCTYQFKDAIKEKTVTELLVIGSEEEDVLEKRLCVEDKSLGGEFNFSTLQGICDKFILTYDSNRLYIFDVTSGKLAFYTSFASGIKQVAMVKTHLYVWQNNLELVDLAVVELETLLLSTLYRKQYYLCTDLCLEFKSELLNLLESSKRLYLLYALKTKISGTELLEQLGPIFGKIQQTNEKVLSQKTNIVQVENLYSNQQVPVQSSKKPLKGIDHDLKLIMKQYRLNKTHSTIDIPEVADLLQTFDCEQLFQKLQQFKDFAKTELDEDATAWCRLRYLKEAAQRSLPYKDLPNEIFDFVTEGVITENSSVNYSCPCGYPLPKCHKYPPKFYSVAVSLYETRRNTDQMLKNVPYLWKRRVKTDVYGLNMTTLIQYSDLELFKKHTLQLTYDSWHDILGYFVKINKGLCLNCDSSIELESLITWSDVGKAVVQSLGAKNAIRILEKYEKSIPNGALDATFYQSCIFAHTLANSDQVQPEAPFQFVEGLSRIGYEQFQDTIAKYFKRKYAASKNPCYTICPENTGTCLICNLPLKNDILIDCQTVKECGHKFHQFCFDKGGRICTLCD